MAAFLNRLVNRFSGKSPEAPQVYLCGFGKHPGYQDHFEHMPPGSQRLPALWDLFYERGIKSLIGAWRQLPPEQRIAEFNHVFTWCAGDAIIVGRFWSSSDGASPPRKDFPLVVCAECRGVPLAWALEHVPPVLERLESQCKATTSLDAVLSAIDAAQQDLRVQAAPRQPAFLDDELSGDALRQLATHAGLKEDQGLLRVLYHVQRDWDSARGPANGGARHTIRHTHQARVPALDSPTESMLLWCSAMLGLLVRETPILIIAPQERPWADLIIGEPAPAQFACIRASLENIPLTTSIPYSLDAAFLAAFGPLIGEEPAVATVETAPPAPVAAEPPPPPPAPAAPEPAAQVPPPTAVAPAVVPSPVPPPPAASLSVEPVAEEKPAVAEAPGLPSPPAPPQAAAGKRLYMIGLGIAAAALLMGYVAYRVLSKGPAQIAQDQPKVSPATAPSVAPVTKPVAVANAATTAAQVAPATRIDTPTQQVPAAPDPRLAWDGQAKLDSLAAKAKTLKEQYQAEIPPSLDAFVADARQRIQQVKKFAWNPQNQPAIEEEIKRLSGEIAQHLAAIDKDLQEQEAYAAWAKDIRGTAQIASSPALNGEWARARDEALGAKADHSATKSLVQSIQDVLTRVDRESAPPANNADAPAPAIAAAVAAHREQALAAAMPWIKAQYGQPAAAAFDEKLAELKAEQTQYRTKAADAIAAFDRIKSMLDEARLLDEPVGDGTIRKLHSTWTDDPIAKTASIAKAIAPVRQRVEALVALEKLQDRKQLIDAAAAAKDRPEIVLAAWQKLQAMPLKSFSTLDGELGLLKSAQAIVDSFKDESRRAAANAQLTRQKQSLWQADALLAATEQDLLAWLARMGEFGVGEASIDDARLRYDLALQRLKQAAAKASDDAAAAKAVDQFAADVAAVPALSGDADTARLLGDLKKTQAPAEGAGGLSGPASASGWSRQDLPDGPQYSWAGKSGTAYTLKFLRVQSKEGNTFYLGQAEIPVGLFIELIDNQGDWAAINALMPPSKTINGISVWEWDKSFQPPKMKLASAWDSRVSPKVALYDTANGINPGRPTAEHPVQQVSLVAAAYFARLIGCRLPTVAEWEQACARCQESTAAPGWNLRDRTWAVEYDYANGLRGRGVITELPLRGFFEALDDSDFLEQKPKVWGKSLKAAAAGADDRYDDGVLWFRPVNADSSMPFKDLVGNVAEFACNDMSLWSEIARRPPGDVHSIIEQRRRNTAFQPFVIGGSAMSSPNKPLSDRRPLNDIDGRYADVGLRLAFTVAGKPASERLKELVGKQAYRLAAP